MKIDKREQK